MHRAPRARGTALCCTDDYCADVCLLKLLRRNPRPPAIGRAIQPLNSCLVHDLRNSRIHGENFGVVPEQATGPCLVIRSRQRVEHGMSAHSPVQQTANMT
jgi:hypothetical protein